VTEEKEPLVTGNPRAASYQLFCALSSGNPYQHVGIHTRRSACPDNEITQSSRRSSRPSSFDRICQATHEYALEQRPLFGRSGRLKPVLCRGPLTMIYGS
jgi:hypothetical protein